MKTLIFRRPLIIITALALAGITTACAEENASTIKFSNPSKPGTLKVVVARGDIHIQGANRPDVIVKSEAQSQNRPRKDGLRVLTESSTYSVDEKDNVITLDASSNGIMGGAADFDVTVPQGTSVVVLNSLGGDVTCRNIAGDIEIKTLHGEVKLVDIGGGAVVDTLNGEIVASVHELHNGKALSFTSMNGEVKLQVAPDAKANVRLRTQNGTILTDFDEKALVTKVENLPGGMHQRGHAVFTPEVREAFREAARAGAIAAQHAAAAVREAAQAAKEGAEEQMGDDDKTGARAVPPMPPIPPVLPSIPPVTGGKLVSGTLNGGGAEINVTTMNGDITLRQLTSK